MIENVTNYQKTRTFWIIKVEQHVGRRPKSDRLWRQSLQLLLRVWIAVVAGRMCAARLHRFGSEAGRHVRGKQSGLWAGGRTLRIRRGCSQEPLLHWRSGGAVRFLNRTARMPTDKRTDWWLHVLWDLWTTGQKRAMRWLRSGGTAGTTRWRRRRRLSKRARHRKWLRAPLLAQAPGEGRRNCAQWPWAVCRGGNSVWSGLAQFCCWGRWTGSVQRSGGIDVGIVAGVRRSTRAMQTSHIEWLILRVSSCCCVRTGRTIWVKIRCCRNVGNVQYTVGIHCTVKKALLE